MKSRRWLRAFILSFTLYVGLCVLAGAVLAEFALRPQRRPLDLQYVRQAFSVAREHFGGELETVSLAAADGARLQAWYLRPHNANGHAVILLHGVADNRLGVGGHAQVFAARGFSVLLPDARAHGESGGDFATYGIEEADDARRWAAWLSERSEGCVFALGESMGAAIALQAAPGARMCAVAAESPFASFREVAFDRVGQHFGMGPWVGRWVLRPVVESGFLYARWRYDIDLDAASPERQLASAEMPVLLVHGDADVNIPLRHSRALARVNPARVSLWEIPGVGHTGALGRREDFEKHVVDWFLQVAANPQR